MSEASRLIEQAESLAGCRWDDPNSMNAMYALMGARARAKGTSCHAPRDDVEAGMFIANQNPRGSAKAEAKEMFDYLIANGLSVDEIYALNRR